MPPATPIDTPRPLRAVALAVALLLAVAGLASCSGKRPTLAAAGPTSSTGSTTTLATTTTLAPDTVQVAQARDGLDSLDVFDRPDGSVTQSLPNPDPELNTPQVFTVVSQTPGWVQVNLPTRPNGSTGWVHGLDVTLSQHDYRIDIALGAHQLTLSKGGQQVLHAPIGVGTVDNPTPPGVYYTKAVIIPLDKNGNKNPAFGPYAYALSGHSDTLTEFLGGDGRLAIHGTNNPSSVGKDASHGCIRLTNDVITRMVEEIKLPLGVPVHVTA